MTTAEERTRATVGAREFLCTLARVDEPIDLRLVRTLAIYLLRHFPTEGEILQSHVALPDVWSQPHKKDCTELELLRRRQSLPEAQTAEAVAIAINGIVEVPQGDSQRVAYANAFHVDSQQAGLSSSSRLKCAWEAIYLCCCEAANRRGWILDGLRHPDLAVLNIGMCAMNATNDEHRQVLRLYEWEIDWMTTPEPFTIEEAISLSASVLARTATSSDDRLT